MQSQEKEYLSAAARLVEQQALDNPGIGIPVDPEVADFMGAFESSENFGEVVTASLGGQENDH